MHLGRRDLRRGHVTAIELEYDSVQTLPAAIGGLAHLTVLNLRNNQLSGNVSGWAKPLSQGPTAAGLALYLSGNGCLTSGGDTVLAVWLEGKDALWDAGCPVGP